MSQAVKGKLFLLGKFSFSLTLSLGLLLLELWLSTRPQGAPTPRVRPPRPSCQWGGLQPSVRLRQVVMLVDLIAKTRSSGSLLGFCLECMKQRPESPRKELKQLTRKEVSLPGQPGPPRLHVAWKICFGDLCKTKTLYSKLGVSVSLGSHPVLWLPVTHAEALLPCSPVPT